MVIVQDAHSAVEPVKVIVQDAHNAVEPVMVIVQDAHSAVEPVMVIFAPIQIILRSTFFGCLTPDAFAGICLAICLTDSNELFLVVIFSFKILFVSLVPC
jgi:hypothetical protein